MRHHGGFQLTREPAKVQDSSQSSCKLLDTKTETHFESWWKFWMKSLETPSFLKIPAVCFQKDQRTTATAQQHGRKQGHSGRPLSTFLLNNNAHTPEVQEQKKLKKGPLFSEERIVLKSSFFWRDIYMLNFRVPIHATLSGMAMLARSPWQLYFHLHPAAPKKSRLKPQWRSPLIP